MSKMKTVSDFKKAGLVFVRGDTCCDVHDGDTLYGHPYGWVNSTNHGVETFFSDTANSFAWRENTGEKPSFSGLIEYETCDGIYNSGHTDCVNFSVLIDGKTVIKKWRPSLDQSSIQTETPEEKELFEVMATQAEPAIDKGEKYQVTIRNRHTGDTLQVDTYDMIVALGITCPAMAHAFKKIANAGTRGVKDYNTDCNEAINSIEQSKLLQKWVA